MTYLDFLLDQLDLQHQVPLGHQDYQEVHESQVVQCLLFLLGHQYCLGDQVVQVAPVNM